MKTLLYRVLIVDDEESIRTLIEGRLGRKGFETRTAASGREALEALEEFHAQVVITDLRMPGMDGFELLSKLRVPTIIITGHGDKESAIRAVEAGAFAFFEKPFDLDALEVMVRRGAEKHLMEVEREELTRKLDRLCKLQGRELENWDRSQSSTLIGNTPRMRELHTLLERLAQKPHAGLLILGETGTGKEVVAQELHRLTHSASDGRSPFLALNCSAIPADLLESELFGHEKGSFSGAHAARIGLAEAVREGTLFLDEIGELDPRHQAKILRLLQERRFRRVGANSEQSFAGRIIAATHRDLPRLASEGRFREDLYYRLSVVTAVLPPLRDRKEDLPALAQKLCAKHGMKGLHPLALEQARAHTWPGNVRELNNWIERAAILGLHDDQDLVTADITTEGVSKGALRRRSSDVGAQIPDTGDLKSLRAQVLDEYDRRWIENALTEHDGNISAAAKALGIDRKNLTRRIRELNIPQKKAA
jgi:DNA-binding NtrC family response regulator